MICARWGKAAGPRDRCTLLQMMRNRIRMARYVGLSAVLLLAFAPSSQSQTIPNVKGRWQWKETEKKNKRQTQFTITIARKRQYRYRRLQRG